MDPRLAAGACLLAVAAPALAADLQVGKGKRYSTIQAAVDAAGPGDRVVVSKGVYRENVAFSGRDGLTLVGRGAVWDGTRSRGVSGDCLVFESDGVTVEGFTFRNGRIHVNALGSEITVRRCVSRNATGGLARLQGADATIASCRISGAKSAAVEISGDSAAVTSTRIANCVGGAIRISGDRAALTRNILRTIAEGEGMVIQSEGAQIDSNKVTNTARTAILVSGVAAVVRRNVCAHTAQEASIVVVGLRPTVDDNRVTGAPGGGIVVVGDAMTVRRNRVSVTGPLNPGFRLDSDSEAGGGTVEDNVADRADEFGFLLMLSNASVRRCAALDCGRAAGAGFLVGGRQTSIVGCRAEGALDTAFLVSGVGLEFENCTARSATGDGFQVRGNDNTFTGCDATDCGGEGLDNGAVETALDGCTLRGNRIDLACDAWNGATFHDAARLERDNTWVTGGPDRQPEVDF